MEADHREQPTNSKQKYKCHRQHTLHRDSADKDDPRDEKTLMHERSLRATNRQDDLSFVLGRVKKDSIAVHSPAKVSTSVYHKDFHSRLESGLQEGFGERIAVIRNLQQRRFNCPSLYKSSSYEAQFVKPVGDAVQLRKQSNNHRIFERGDLSETSTYQSGFRAPKKVVDETAKPIRPSPEQPFANNERFRGQSIYRRQYVNLPKITRERTSGCVDHLTEAHCHNQHRQSQYKQNFEPKRQDSISKCVPKSNAHYFPQSSFFGQFLSSYKKNYH